MEILEKITEAIASNCIEEALNLIEENTMQLDKYAEFWNIKGVISIKVSEFKIAIECLKKSIEIDKYNIDANYNLAYAYEISENYYDALKTYKGILNITEDDNLKEEICVCIDKITNIVKMIDCEVIIKNTDTKIAPQPGDDIYSCRSNTLEAIIDCNAPLISICVLGYNNLEKYTKTCVECILKYTQNIDYELILVDNGSTDKTFEYFKSIPFFKKKIVKITKNIGMMFGAQQGLYYSSGKYFVGIANDVYVTKNWLSNMLKCAMSDSKIGMINPVCDYVSNNQSVDLGYKDFDDMQEKASIYNVSDPKKWDERLRLITIATLYRKECLDIIGFSDYGFFHDFGDDDITFRIRRAGYKAILCKDVFVSHAGKITDKGAALAEKSIEKGKKIFKDKYYGIDAWEDVNNYEPEMMSFIELEKKEYKILGIDILCGTPLLEAKNKLRNASVFNVDISAFTTKAKYWLDLSTICDSEVKCDRIEYIKEHFEPHNFDYIILGIPINLYGFPYKVLDNMLELLTAGGSLLLKVRNNYDLRNFLYVIGQYQNPHEDILSHVDINNLNAYLEHKGYYIKNISGESHVVNEDNMKLIMDKVTSVNNNNNAQQVFNKLLINDYIIKISKI